MKVNVQLPEGSSTKLIRNTEASLDVISVDDDCLTFQVKVGWKTALFLTMWVVNVVLNVLGLLPTPL